MQKLAVIDLGSNSLRMIIWRVKGPGCYIVEDKAKEMLRLGAGIGKDNILQTEPMLRALAALRVFAGIMRSHEVTHVKAVATAALRRAENRDQFLDRAFAETGIRFTVISGEEESADAYYGVVNTLPINDAVLIDTGGGSCQIILVRNRRLARAASLPLGAMLLSEQFLSGKNDPPSDKQIKALYGHIGACINAIEWFEEMRGLPVVALGGANRSLAKVCMNIKSHALPILHGYTISAEDVEKTVRSIGKLKEKERGALPGIDRSRADIIIGGLAPLTTLMRLTGARELITSVSGLREGLMYRTLHPQDPLLPDVFECSLMNMVETYGVDRIHAESVARLTLSLYEQLLALHEVPKRYLRALMAAAMLHDIGRMVEYDNHEAHGFYLMTCIDLYGLTHSERIWAALLVSMHRIEDAKVDWRGYEGIITREDVDQIAKLSVLLKMAEKLDRNQPGKVRRVECYIGPDTIEMLLQAESGSTALQVSAAMKSERVFEKVFDRKLIVM